MALIAFDGFDHYTSVIGAGDILTRTGSLIWTYSQINGFPGGRGGFGRAIQIANTPGPSLVGALAAAFKQFFCGFALQMNSIGAANVAFLDMTTGTEGTTQFSVAFNFTTATIQIFNGAGALQASSGSAAFTPALFNYVEIGGVVGNPGSVTVRINGVQVLTFAFNTVLTANAWVNGVSFGSSGGGSGNQYYLDDLYWCDQTVGPGANPCNTFLGDVTVDTLYPTSNDAVAWTPLSGTNWQEISEAAFDGDASYNSTATVGAVDTFTFGALRSTATQVLAVQVVGAYRKDDATTRTVQQRVVSGGTTATGGTVSIPTSYTYDTDLFVVDPATTANWTVAGVNAMRAGYELVS